MNNIVLTHTKLLQKKIVFFTERYSENHALIQGTPITIFQYQDFYHAQIYYYP